MSGNIESDCKATKKVYFRNLSQSQADFLVRFCLVPLGNTILGLVWNFLGGFGAIRVDVSILN